jgi:prepilin-type N-terminal cleavage/methylation domain-containing protein
MFSKLKKQTEGFTIIEVLIVLAIAGLIMLIVFLAVPALQRNARNTQRNNDAATIAAGVNDCLANKNGQVSSCNTAALVGVYLDTAKLNQLTTVFAAAASTSAAQINFGTTAGSCNTAGDATAAGGSARAFSVVYQLESTSATPNTRCLAS